MTSHDGALMGVLTQHKSLPDFLDTLFGFLRRKTDLFETLSEKKGFREGAAEQLVLDSFRSQMAVVGKTASPSRLVQPPGPVNPQSQPSQPYNGGRTAKYSWSQTTEEVSVEIAVSGKKDLVVLVEPRRLSVRVKDQLLVEGELGGEVNKQESTWTYSGGLLTITMEKSTNRKTSWWKSAIVGDEEIDTSKVDSSKQLKDLDEKTQAKIRQLMFDQQQRAKGLPSSDELVLEETLRKAWDAEGSPFKGTPFDPSVVK